MVSPKADHSDNNGEDIEHQPSSSSRTRRMTTIEAEDQIHHKKVEAGKKSTSKLFICKFFSFIFYIAATPISVTFSVFSSLVPHKIRSNQVLKSKGYKSTSEHFKSKSIYEKVYEITYFETRLVGFSVVTSARLGFLALIWLIVNLCFPSFRAATLFGSILWKWSLLAAVLLLGYPFTLHTCRRLYLAVVIFGDLVGIDDIEYFTWELKNNVATLMYFSWVLAVWMGSFESDQGLKLKLGSVVDKYGRSTFVSLLVGAVLGVVKRAALSQWKAEAIYKRFKTRILMAGFQLYFLFIVVDGLRQDHRLLPWRYQRRFKKWIVIEEGEIRETYMKGENKRRSIQDLMVLRDLTLRQIHRVVRLVAGLGKVTPREGETIAEVLEKCEAKILDENNGRFVSEEFLVGKFEGLDADEAHLLLEEVRAKYQSDEISFESLRKWMVDSHKNCLSLGRTLTDALAVVSILDGLLSCCIVALVTLLWLLVTGLATTKVLVTIASPFLALTFVFGDTCKTFFQGVIFSFVTHPFDIGDRCIVDGVEVEVKQIGILTTTCIKIGTKEKMMYPNSDLSTKLIIKLEGELDATDTIELVLDSSTSDSQAEDVWKFIEELLRCKAEDGALSDSYEVKGLRVRERIKLSISFKHAIDIEGVSHSEWHQKKKRQRLELLTEVEQFLEQQQIKFGKTLKQVCGCTNT